MPSVVAAGTSVLLLAVPSVVAAGTSVLLLAVLSVVAAGTSVLLLAVLSVAGGTVVAAFGAVAAGGAAECCSWSVSESDSDVLLRGSP